MAEQTVLKRKIAAIFAADIAGYSRLVAEDEEETLRRLAAYREVVDDFIARAGGRIFNTAGDAVLAEFPSAVEAVRCAIDIQESLRTRNMAFPPNRQMSYRIGITIGDVVERDGDLLGDGVNIAARLEGLADVGGICISRAVHEQVANKLSVQFADMGAREVKNIPTPVHAFRVAMRREDGTYAPVPKKAGRLGGVRRLLLAAAATAGALVAIAAGTSFYLDYRDAKPAQRDAAKAAAEALARLSAKPASPGAASSTPASTPTAAGQPSPAPLVSQPAPSPSTTTAATEKFAPDAVPFVSERTRIALARDYAPAPAHKAFATTINGVSAYVTGQASEEAAKTAALEQCQQRAEASNGPRKCELYAVGDDVVYAHSRPPLPAQPWVRHDPLTERAFSASDMPLIRDTGRDRLAANYGPARRTKAIALGPGGQFFFSVGGELVDDVVRRNLEACGAQAGTACIIVALDDTFVVPVPTVMKATGFFHVASHTAIAAESRDEVARRLAAASSGWNAIAVGTSGHPGYGLNGDREETAIGGALADCATRDQDCRVIAIGPFTVEDN
ncbi:Putative adenylate cyclase [Bradyrhizobium sp. ORS 285]|uniref:adenylate/guanylate cyclase domain-containing protein n=1 Tax=Bradyrhizobium sp. ORS 285 TaxID=115808 RepID=UPI0002408387|nr:adenylate/guanylate cyclase domain-containing protein [Bradyrhizobium sp. ORS 285]CCD83870.1 putative adenylate cyclase [Bradyrhizobium sp. ORS 285]SMX61835.1 Putative adenylate cyclase [Bradyrhizobium sp. ORS 285]